MSICGTTVNFARNTNQSDLGIFARYTETNEIRRSDLGNDNHDGLQFTRTGQ